jgi:4-hydroxybenzoate polyprenyltransferase
VKVKEQLLMSDDVNQANQDVQIINSINQIAETQIDMLNDRPSRPVTTSAFDGGVTVIAVVVGLGIVFAAILSIMSSHYHP